MIRIFYFHIRGSDDRNGVRGTRISPSEGILQRLMTVFTSRWFIASIVPLPGITETVRPARAAMRPAHARGINDYISINFHFFIVGKVLANHTAYALALKNEFTTK